MQSLRICFVGDSLVNGTGDPACLGWTGRVCAAACDAGHDITYYNLGIRRATSADIHGYWRDEVTRRLPEGIAGRARMIPVMQRVQAAGKGLILRKFSPAELEAILPALSLLAAFDVVFLALCPLLFEFVMEEMAS